jgi:hypothetical protein
MGSPRFSLASFALAALLPAAVHAAREAAPLPASWDQCFCSSPTNDPYQPYVNKRYGTEPGCTELWRERTASVWFGCQDAESVARARCFCRGPKDQPQRYSSEPECLSAPLPEKPPAASLIACEEVASLARASRGDCYCVRRTGDAKHPREAARFDWSARCMAMRFDWLDAELPSCEDAARRLGACACACADKEGAPRLKRGRPSSCAAVRYLFVPMRQDDSAAQVVLPRCGPDTPLEPKTQGGR